MIKNNIRRLRRSQELSQHKLAEILGVNQTLISAWELGKSAPDEENVKDLADYFGVSPAYVLGKSQTPHDPHCLDFAPESVPAEYRAKNYDECFLLETFRVLPSRGQQHLMETAKMLAKYYE